VNLTITHLDDNNKSLAAGTPKKGHKDKTIPMGLTYNALVDPEADIVPSKVLSISQREQTPFRTSQMSDLVDFAGNSQQLSDRVSDHAADGDSVMFDSGDESTQLGQEEHVTGDLDLDSQIVLREDLSPPTESFEDALLHAGATQATETTGMTVSQDKRNKDLLHGMVFIILVDTYSNPLITVITLAALVTP